MPILSHDNRPWYKEPWPWILMLGPGIVVVAGFFTAWLAIRSNDGLVADDYYKQGLAVNQQLQKEHKAEALGLRAEVMVSGSQLRVMLTAREQMTLPPTVTMKISHPTLAGRDQAVVLTAEGQGMYGGRLAAEISGRWLVTLEEPSGEWRLRGEWRAGAVEPLRLGAG